MKLLLHSWPRHYYQSVLLSCCSYLVTALFLPGALVLTVTGGMMSVLLPAMIYVNIGGNRRSHTGLSAQPLSARQDGSRSVSAATGPVQPRDGPPRPQLPAHPANYSAGTILRGQLSARAHRHSAQDLYLDHVAGVLPGSLVDSFAGNEFGTVNRPKNSCPGRSLWPCCCSPCLPCCRWFTVTPDPSAIMEPVAGRNLWPPAVRCR